MSVMALREEMERQGQWLFRWRSYFPVAVLAVLAAGLPGFQYPHGVRSQQEFWEAICLLISLSGVVVRALVVGYTPAGTSGRNTAGGQIAESLNTAGLYAYVRHPLYFGNFLMWLGIAMMLRSAWIVVVVSLIFWLYYERIMLAEEAFLRQRFGQAYEVWATMTPAFFPRCSAVAGAKWVAPTLSFSLRNVLRREYSGLLAVATLCALIDALAAWSVGENPLPGRFATVVVFIGVVLYVALRSLKRHTGLLDVAGR